MRGTSSWFQRLVLPGFAFKAVVIGGGYATGRELATFFLPSGPVGGLLAMLVTTIIWGVVCCLTFLLSFETRSLNYYAFSRRLLGPCWPAFEIVYFLSLIAILAVFAAASGAIGEALFSLPQIVGTLALVLGIALIAAWVTTRSNECSNMLHFSSTRLTASSPYSLSRGMAIKNYCASG